MKRLTTLLFCTIMVFTVFGVANAGLNDGLVAHWSFDNCDSADDSGNGNDGVIIGNPECIDGIKNKAFKFDGSQYIEILDNKFMDGYCNITISSWINIKSDDSQQHQILSSGDLRSGIDPISLQIVDNKPSDFGFQDTINGLNIRIDRSSFNFIFQNNQWYLITTILEDTDFGSHIVVYVGSQKIHTIITAQSRRLHTTYSA